MYSTISGIEYGPPQVGAGALTKDTEISIYSTNIGTEHPVS